MDNNLPTNNQPCPSCGYCPTCGQRRYQYWPYYYTSPVYTTSTGQVGQASTHTISTGQVIQ